jgi:hypothetical protein
VPPPSHSPPCLLALASLSWALAAHAADDPYVELRTLSVDRVLLCDDMYPTGGEGVVWIDNPAEIAWLLAPVTTRQGPAALCGYQRALYFFRAGQLLARHRLNTECHDYVPGRRPDSRLFAGELAARWRPYLDRLETSTWTWDAKVVFPSTVTPEAARAALRTAGLDAFTLPKDDDDRTPWAMVRYEEAEDPAESWWQPVSRETQERIVGILAVRCRRGACQVEDISPSERFDRRVTYDVRVRFVTNADLAAFRGSLRWLWSNPAIQEVHPAPPLFWIRTVLHEPPTDALLLSLQRRIPGASSVELGDLRQDRRDVHPWMTPSPRWWQDGAGHR